MSQMTCCPSDETSHTETYVDAYEAWNRGWGSGAGLIMPLGSGFARLGRFVDYLW